jgi:beta-xylosidase
VNNFKRAVLLLIVTFNALSGFSQRGAYLFSYFSGNGEDGLHLLYSYDGLKWEKLNGGNSFLKPEVGISKLMRDPCIIRTKDGIFHMVWTAGWTEKGIGYAWSKDLVNWSDQKYLEVMAHEDNARNCWAPEIIFDEKEKQFLIFWSTTVTGRFSETEAQAESKYNHRIYCTTTKNFESFSETMLFYEPGFNVIDATIARDRNRYVMFIKDETVSPSQKNIRIAFSKSLYGPYGKASVPITGNYWAEGPTVLKNGKGWTVYFDKYREHSYGAVRSSDLRKWEDLSGAISFPEGTRHGTIFKIRGAELRKILLRGEK